MGDTSKGCTVNPLIKEPWWKQVARLLVDIILLSTKLGVITTNVAAAMRDRASVNYIAMHAYT